MASHYSDMGFTVNSSEDIIEIVKQIYPNAKEVSRNKKTYQQICVDKFIEFWLNLKNGAIEEIEFHYNSENFAACSFEQYISYSEEDMAGIVQVNNGLCPVVIEIPNLGLFERFMENQKMNLQISAYAHEVNLFDSEDAYAASQGNREHKFATEHFLPVGLFTENEGDSPSAQAVFGGKILEYELRKNPLTGLDYYYFAVTCQGSVYDIVADPALVKTKPQVGGVLNGHFWLSGKIV